MNNFLHKKKSFSVIGLEMGMEQIGQQEVKVSAIWWPFSGKCEKTNSPAVLSSLYMHRTGIQAFTNLFQQWKGTIIARSERTISKPSQSLVSLLKEPKKELPVLQKLDVDQLYDVSCVEQLSDSSVQSLIICFTIISKQLHLKQIWLNYVLALSYWIP